MALSSSDVKLRLKDAVGRARQAYRPTKTRSDNCMNHLIVIYELEPVLTEILVTGVTPGDEVLTKVISDLKSTVQSKPKWADELASLSKKEKIDQGKVHQVKFENPGDGGGGAGKPASWELYLLEIWDAFEKGDDFNWSDIETWFDIFQEYNDGPSG